MQCVQKRSERALLPFLRAGHHVRLHSFCALRSELTVLGERWLGRTSSLDNEKQISMLIVVVREQELQPKVGIASVHSLRLGAHSVKSWRGVRARRSPVSFATMLGA